MLIIGGRHIVVMEIAVVVKVEAVWRAVGLVLRCGESRVAVGRWAGGELRFCGSSVWRARGGLGARR